MLSESKEVSQATHLASGRIAFKSSSMQNPILEPMWMELMWKIASMLYTHGLRWIEPKWVQRIENDIVIQPLWLASWGLSFKLISSIILATTCSPSTLTVLHFNFRNIVSEVKILRDGWVPPSPFPTCKFSKDASCIKCHVNGSIAGYRRWAKEGGMFWTDVLIWENKITNFHYPLTFLFFSVPSSCYSDV